MIQLPDRLAEAVRREAQRRGMLAARPPASSPTEEPQETSRYSPWYSHTPFKTQRLLLRAGEFASVPRRPIEIYGGAVGGGKTDGLIMWAAEGVEYPDYACLLGRKRMVDMEKPGGVLDQAHKAFRGTGAQWSAKLMQYQFPSGAVIQFGPMETLADIKDRYQGPAFARIGIDEGGLLHWSWIAWLRTRIRKPIGLPISSGMLITANPLGVCHDEMVEEFGLTDEARAKAFGKFEDKGDYILSDDTLFIPANLYDNPYLDHREYELQFAHLDVEVRDALLRGRWDVKLPGIYFREDHFQIVPAAAAPRFEHYIRAHDIAVTGKGDRAGTGLGGWDAETDLDWFHEVRTWQRKAVDVKEAMIDIAKTDPRGTITVMDNDNATQVVIQDLVKYHKFVELPKGFTEATVRETVSRKGFPVYALSVGRSRTTRDAAGRNDGFTNHAYADKVRFVKGEWNDETIGMLLRLQGKAGDKDEEWDVLGLIHNAARRFGGRTLPAISDRRVIESPLEREERLAQRPRRRARLFAS